jgi:hypothetical protein
MRAHFINEESGYYPVGTENDPNAPWNQPKSETFEEIKLEDGEVFIITNERIGANDWEEIDREQIDPETLEQLIASKLELNYKAMLEENDIIEIEDINCEGSNCEFITDHGDVTISINDLENLI